MAPICQCEVTWCHCHLFCADNSWHATRLQYNYTVRLRHGTLIKYMTLPFACTRRIMIWTRMRANIKLIRNRPNIRRILRCESPYFHHWSATTWHLVCGCETTIAKDLHCGPVLSFLGPLRTLVIPINWRGAGWKPTSWCRRVIIIMKKLT